MPLYEYSCRKCSNQFEVLVRGGDTPACPSCQGRDLERRLSVFAAHTAGVATKPVTSGPCGTCGDPRGPGACSFG